MSSKFRIPMILVAAAVFPAVAGGQTGELISGTIDSMRVLNASDPFSEGEIVVSGQKVVIPRNLLIDLPANRLTLSEMFTGAPPAALALGESGLATLDQTKVNQGSATILANRQPDGTVIAGEVSIEKGGEVVTGIVTFIDYTDGYFVIDGAPGDPNTGIMIRINDPDGRYTIQQGRGCDGGPNCSPDARYGVDPDNYTITATTGVPMTIPSTVPVSQRSGFDPVGDAAIANAASNGSGVGDPFAPQGNRLTPMLDSRFFAPINVGDSLTCEGNFEFIAGQYFLSVHTVFVHDALLTRRTPDQPDYFIWDEVEWDAPGFSNLRVKCLYIGFSSLSLPEVDMYALHVDRDTGENVEYVIGSTVNNPDTLNHGIAPLTAGNVFKINYDVDFINEVDDRRSPCQNLINAGFGDRCPGGGLTHEENFNILSPISRELIGRSRHKASLLPGIITRDINGNEATNGEYLTPVGIGHPEFGEIDLDALQSPFIFAGIPWNIDRRLGPGGCGDACTPANTALEPFPVSNLDPRLQGLLSAPITAQARNRVFAFHPFAGVNILPWPPNAPAPRPITPTLKPVPGGGGGGGPTGPLAQFSTSSDTGEIPFTVSFMDQSTGNVTSWLWAFGDGSTSTLQNPMHTFSELGAFSPILIVNGPDGSDTAAVIDGITVNEVAPTVLDVDFLANRTSGPAPLSVRFRSQVVIGTADTGTWDFGDGGTSILRNPLHVYTTPGTYTVSLTGVGPDGTDTETKVGFITVTP